MFPIFGYIGFLWDHTIRRSIEHMAYYVFSNSIYNFVETNKSSD